MDGGIGAAHFNRFELKIQERVRQMIADRHKGKLLVLARISHE
jgi:hypothetical protein